MSTLKVDTITDSSSGLTTTINGFTPNIGNMGGRNIVINGAMQVAQRGTSRSFGGTYNTLDRWAMGQYQQAGHEQVSVTDTSVPVKKAIKVTSSSTSEASSGTRMALAQIVESQNCDFLAGKTVTLSFYIRFSDATMTGGGDFLFQLNEYDSVDPNLLTTGATRENNTTIAQGSLPTSWTKYTKTITCSSTMKNLGARFLFSNLFNTTANSDEWYEVTGVQLEVGSTATPFEHRSYGDELLRCQRYFEKKGQSSTSTAWAFYEMNAVMAQSTNYVQGDKFKVEKRTDPTLVFYSRNGTSGKISLFNNGADATGSWTQNAKGATGFHAVVGPAASITKGDGYEYGYTADAEL
jgi:hypothetical protein